MPQPFDRYRVCTFALITLCAACTGIIESDSYDSDSDPISGASSGSNDGDDGDGDGNAGATAGSNGGQDSDTGANSPTPVPGGDPTTPTATPVPAKDLALREVAVYQGVKIPIAQGVTDIVARKASVIAGRPALVRVFVDPSATFAARTITARLTLNNPGAVPVEINADLQVSAASRDETLTSTFNFEVAGDLLRPDTEFSVALLEAGAPAGNATAIATNRVPETGVAPLGAQSSGSPFRVVIVPVRYNGDGSGRIPGTDAADVQSFRDRLFALLPTNQLEVSVAPAMDFNTVVSANGAGWTELLEQCLAKRNADRVDAKTYYYCMFDPAVDFGKYCGGSCVAGLGPVPQARDTFNRAAIGLGFGDAAGTMAHELGHTLGRPHAPCGGVAGPDPGYPYSGGLIGSWGYDLVSKKFFSPTDSTDLMGYCSKAWISDYNYNLVFQRFQTVLAAPQLQGTPVEALSIVVDADQSLRVGNAITFGSQPEGESVVVNFIDGQGGLLQSDAGTFVAVSHITGGILYVSRPPAGTARIDVEGFGSVALN